MKRATSNQFIRFFRGTKAWITILILIATVVQPKASLGQTEKASEGFGGMLMSDASIPEFVALSKFDGVFSNKDDKEKSLKPLLAVKKNSLECRLKQAKSSFDVLRTRTAHAEAELERWREMVEEKSRKSQSESTGFPISRSAAEQLLISAQLELQKVTWDLASEMALLEIAAITKETAESRVEEYEERLAGLESTSIVEDLQFAQNELKRVEELQQRGAMSANDAVLARQSVSKAQSSFQMHALRRQLAVAQQHALKNAQSAEVKIQIRRLTARKEQIEKYIKEVFNAVNDLAQREQLLARTGRNEETIGTLTKLQVELQIKMDEIEGLLSALDSVEFAEKKE